MKVFHLNGPAPLETNSFVLVGGGNRAVAIDPAPGLADFDKVLEGEGASLEAILLTQHLANLGAATWEGQRRLYQSLARGPLKGVRLLIKPHPDDGMDYREIFPKARVLRQVFPAELLPYAFLVGPRVVYTLDSTSCENLKRHFIIIQLGRDHHGP